jgi:hypothetical protein
MTESNASSIRTLPSFLTWEAGNDLVRTACETYIGSAYHQLREWSQSAQVGLFEAVVRLPKSAQRRLLLAPRLHYLLCSRVKPSADDIESLQRYIQMEQYLCDQNAQPPCMTWTALGDYYWPAQTTTSARAEPASNWNVGQPYHAPVLKGIVLDAYSPLPNNDYPEVNGEIGEHTAAEMFVIEQRLRESLEHIQSVSNTAGSMVGAAIQVISLIRAEDVTGMTQSFSNRAVIGLMGMVNVHAEQWATQTISNAIVHESIHSLIYKLQLNPANVLYTDEAAAQQHTAVSPWSGRTLFLHSFVHACFVWFGLWCFWRLSPVEDALSSRLKEKAQRGFLSGPLLTRLSHEAYDSIHPQARFAIEEMFERVTSSPD